MRSVMAFGIMTLMMLIMNAATAQQIKDGKLWLNDDGSQYFKVTMLGQFWLRNTEMNPGTTINGFRKDQSTDIGIRRARLQAYGQIADRVFLYSQVGMNNFNALADRKAGFFIHDINGDYEVARKKLFVGAGLTAWNGLSRFSAPSVGSILGIDAPLFEQNTNDVTDQFLRKLSIYAKGKLGKLDYRVVMSQPLSVTKSANYNGTIGTHSNFSPMPASMQWHGYLSYQFLDAEANTTAYMTGTYLGTKKVFNIGAGFQYQPDAQWHLGGAGGLDTVQTNMRNIAVDVYYDAPLNTSTGSSISAYAVYMNMFYGPGYLRNQATMNPANGSVAPNIINGGGNGYPSFGTGNLLYGQAGYKFKNNLIGNTTLMPYANLQYAHYDRLADDLYFWDAGINWFLKGQTSKLTFAIQNRPVYEAVAGSAKANLTERKNAFLLQYQVYLN